MNSFLEILCSLSLQVTLLLLLTGWLARRQSDCRDSERLWVGCHRAILILIAAGFLLPHPRLIPALLWPSATMTQAEISHPNDLATGLFLVWVAGAAVQGTALVVSFVSIFRVLHAAQPLKNHPAGLVARLHGRDVRVLVTPLATSPCCWQLHRPVVILPRFLLDFPNDELTVIFRHELTHLAECHPLHLFEQRLVEILFWFHPLIWSASRSAARQREFVSDQLAAADPSEATALLRGMWRLAETRIRTTPTLPAGLAFDVRRTELELRVARLLDRAQTGIRSQPARQSAGALRVVFAAGLAALIWVPVHPGASARDLLSPWPAISATALREFNIVVRDYEIDAHRIRERDIHVSR